MNKRPALKASMLTTFLATILAGCAIKPAEKVTVYKTRGVIQCESQGMSLVQSELQLTGVGVKIIDSQCAVLDGRVFASVCGAETGDIVLHTIDRRHEKLAEAMGYRNALQLKTPDTPEGFQPVECQ
ncbi:hypothetical protein [Grimontia hollisae]|uniref:hypothetical protein n=1 Tax=Grimontia hollisae TaxID=673 RepID=UPI001E4B7521|nr:hypothetical protein [Grimontia hollisae]